MIITKTPFRMSFFGGGTDMEEFFRKNGGAVLSTTFDKYCYVTVRHLPRFFDYSTELSYSKFGAEGYEVLPVIISPDRKKQLNQNLMMFFTGFTRFSSDVQKANAIGKQDKTAQLKEMLSLVDDAEHILTDKDTDLDDFGRMLDHTWKLKRQTGSAVSTNSIDELYAKGIAAGALGGKLLGAGGGGFLVFYVQPDRQDSVRWAMRDLMYIPFAFENDGTRVVHYSPEKFELKA